MSSVHSAIDPAALQQAFEALKSYDCGSGRAVLLPLDSAVSAASGDLAQAVELERQFLAALQTCPSEPARRYIFSKLALIGSESAVSVVAGFLADTHLATAARNALEAIPGKKPATALRNGLAQTAARTGAANSLGARLDEGSVRALAALLKSPELEEAAAAIAALGEIGSSRAAKILRAFYPKSPANLQPVLADAMLSCAESLACAGHASDAGALYRLLDSPAQPKHVREAALRGRK